jgi:hypothetical protein
MARNYLPHSLYTEGSGWHRDASGEMVIKDCRKALENSNYTFGKIGIYLQDNSEYGGAIDVIPGSNRDFFNYPKGRSIPGFWISVFAHLQRYAFPIYKLLSNTNIMSKLTKMINTDIKAGDALIFDSRVFHKGTFARKDIEKNLVYHHSTLQAELPEHHEKYVLYSHFGNSIAIDSYFLDRLNRKGGENEVNEWVEDAKSVCKNSHKHHFFRKYDSLLDRTFCEKF